VLRKYLLERFGGIPKMSATSPLFITSMSDREKYKLTNYFEITKTIGLLFILNKTAATYLIQ